MSTFPQRTDRRMTLALLSVILLSLGIILLTDGASTDANSAQHDSASHRSRFARRPTQQQPYAVANAKKAERFYFDPNTADSTQLLRLGLEPWQVRNIYKYRARGGVYRQPDDFARLYGLTVKQYRELKPYIHISADYQPAASLVRVPTKHSTPKRDTLMRNTPSKISADERVELNTADTTMLRRVPGIGPYFAREIRRYGERLGGYVSLSQLDEIHDFPTEAKRYLVITSQKVRKMNVNQLSLNELRRHPYINYYQAKAITDYRRLHGPLHSLDDLHLSRDFPDEVIQRLAPYVEF